MFILNRNTFPDGHRLVMDNDPKHRSKLTTRWLREKGINHWQTPPQSPVIIRKIFIFFWNEFIIIILKDLNPIENVWHELKTFVRENKPINKIDFIKKIGKFWFNVLTPEKCRRYIEHLPKVLPHVIIQNGFATPF